MLVYINIYVPGKSSLQKQAKITQKYHMLEERWYEQKGVCFYIGRT